MTENRVRVVYIGDRSEVAKEYERRRYTFRHGQAVSVPEAMAQSLLVRETFVLEDLYGIPLDEQFPRGGRILLRRWGALGDLLMFRAAVSAFARRRSGYRFTLRCQDRFAPLFQNDSLFAGVVSAGDPPATKQDGVISFDQVAEADHRGVVKHRVELFLEAMSSMKITIKPEDWSLPRPPETARWVRRHFEARGLLKGQRERPLVGVQVRGSGLMKTLPRHVIRSLVGTMVDTVGDVFLVEPDDAVVRDVSTDRRVHSMCHRDALHTMEALSHVDLLVTMDSGPLWMAHVVGCPVVCIMGPTRGQERLSFHPKYPSGAREVRLEAMIGCTPCFEAAHACSHRFDCMQAQPDWDAVVSAILGEVNAVLRGDVRLPTRV